MILTWPSWHPEQELKSDHLVALEDYLLTRVQLADDGAWGVESMDDWNHCVGVEETPDGKALTVKLRQVRGVTPGGHHVWLWSDTEWLSERMELEDRRGGFDLWIVVNSREKGVPKLTLEPAVVALAELTTPVDPTDMPNALYVGRYRAMIRPGETGIELVHRPIPRRFAGFGSAETGSWHDWVRPLRDRIEAAVRDTAAQLPRTPAQIAAAVELARLRFEWHTLTIPVLARRLKMVDWLRTRAETETFPDPSAAAAPFSFADLTGDHLPQALADLLRLDSEPVLDGSEFGRLLRALARDGITYYAPAAALQKWAAAVESLRTGSPSGENAGMLDEADAFLKTEPRSMNPWARAVALITVSARTQVQSLTQDICDCLAGLYHGEARDARAGPLAFSWLARAAFGDPEIQRRAAPALQLVARILSGASAGREAMDPSDRVCGFLGREAASSIAPAAVRPYLWLPDSALRADLAVPAELRIGLIGAPSSGRSEFARALADACREWMGGAPDADWGPPGDANATEASCRFQADGRTIRLSVVCPQPAAWQGADALGAGWEQQLRAASNWDLLVVAIEPSGVARGDSGELPRLIDGCRRVLDQQPATRLAIAYTKADEYGVIQEQAIRVIHSTALADALNRFRADAGENAWEQFTGSASGDRTSVRREGMASFSRNVKGASGDAEWSATRRWVLRQTRPLWEFAARQQPARLLNGYFVSADSRDPYLASISRGGAQQLLADVFQCFKIGAASSAGRESGTVGTPRQPLSRRELP